jgi:hypothetical protein
MADYKYDPKMPFFNILVPTEDTTKLTYVLSSLLQVGKNVLLKYKKGDLEPQLGTTTSLMGRKSSVGGGIDMATNIKDLKVLHG